MAAAETAHDLVVPRDAEPARLDKWLSDALPFSRARIQALIADGAVTVGGLKVVDGARKVKTGDHIAVRVPAPAAAIPQPQAIALDIVFEDESVIVVNKPAGLVVHPAAGNPDRTLVNALLAHCGESLRGIGGVARPGIVHRLDKDTSGLLVAAKTETAHAALARQFADHTIERRYDALVWGVPRPATGTITGDIGRSPHNRQKMAIVKRGGRHAETGYVTVAAFGTLAAHIQCRLKTGRTHQIRVHMASRGHPLIGDPVYGSGRKLPARADPDLAKIIAAFKRQALHAAVLGFTHPVSGERLSFRAPPPADFAELVKQLVEID
jgi:23S rRNA pseudouridine1911/1915/1917 synthase